MALPLSAVPDLARAFPQPDYYLDEESAGQAVLRRAVVNLIDVRSRDKVGFWLLTEEPFDRNRFARRVTATALGTQFHVSSPEDTILAKLRWAKLSGGSRKQLGDALRVYEVQFSHLDHDYLDHWAEALEVSDLLAQVRTESAPLSF